jgi:hypothetical protein
MLEVLENCSELEELISRHLLHHNGVDDHLEDLSPSRSWWISAAVAVVLEKTVPRKPPGCQCCALCECARGSERACWCRTRIDDAGTLVDEAVRSILSNFLVALRVEPSTRGSLHRQCCWHKNGLAKRRKHGDIPYSVAMPFEERSG